MSNYPEIPIAKKTGSEPFHQSGTVIGFNVDGFWKWAYSNLASNNLRGHLAEFLIAKELGLSDQVRQEWAACDLIMPNGIRIEVKSSAYIQTWNQKALYSVKFGIAPSKRWDEDTDKRVENFERYSDVYIFCLHAEKEQSQFDPTDLDQWIFYVISTKKLGSVVGNQKSISLGRLLKLAPIECRFGDIAASIATALDEMVD